MAGFSSCVKRFAKVCHDGRDALVQFFLPTPAPVEFHSS